MIFTSVFMSFMLMLVFILTTVCFSIMSKVKYEREKFSVFECGFDLLSPLRLPFSINFFMITIIFLIFDVELILVLPIIFNFGILKMNLTSWWLVSFFILLMVGFLYEWMAGLLNWMI